MGRDKYYRPEPHFLQRLIPLMDDVKLLGYAAVWVAKQSSAHRYHDNNDVTVVMEHTVLQSNELATSAAGKAHLGVGW